MGLDTFNKKQAYEREQQAPIKEAQRIEQQIKLAATIRSLETELEKQRLG